MAILTDNVIRQDFRESRVNKQSQTATKVNSKNRPNNEHQEKLTLPEIIEHLDYMVKETKIKYSVDEQDNGFIIKVMDKKTDKLIKEIPSHDIQVLRKHFKNHMGVLFNELI